MAITRRKPLSAEQLAEAKRLKAAWQARDPNLGIESQMQMAERCGWETQGAFSQYVLGKIPLNADALVRICEQLKIDFKTISPRLAADLTDLTRRAGLETVIKKVVMSDLPQEIEDLVLAYQALPPSLKFDIWDTIHKYVATQTEHLAFIGQRNRAALLRSMERDRQRSSKKGSRLRAVGVKT